MMSFEEAVAHAKRELSGATYQTETSPYPGIVAINNVRAEWLSRLIAAAERAEKLEDELRERQEKNLRRNASGAPGGGTRLGP